MRGDMMCGMDIPLDQHNIEIQRNKKAWDSKPLLREIYRNFYHEILSHMHTSIPGQVVEIGAGVGNFKHVCPQAIATDIFPNPWIDRVESVYQLSFEGSSVSNLVLFDVFHHLASPGSALRECKRVLAKSGRVIIFEPYISLFGFFVYGLFHHEPLGLFRAIQWQGAHNNETYYAAEGNATRVFGARSHFKKEIQADWNIVARKKYSALSYVLSGGFSKPALYPESFLPLLRKIEKVLDLFPILFATRVMIVLEKK
jgi:SAM-dependent methyltransferase